MHTWNNVGLFDEFETTDAQQRLQAKFKAFNKYDLVITETAVNVHQCGRCSSVTLKTKKEPALFVDMPIDRSKLLPKHSLFNQINLQQEISTLSQIPHRLLLSRVLSGGIELDDLGLKDKKLDPRLGIGLLALYLAEVHDYGQGCLVQTNSTLARTVPYLMGVVADADKLETPKPLFAAYMKIDSVLLTNDNLSLIDRQVLLPLASLRRKQTIHQSNLKNLQLEFNKSTRLVETNIELLGRIGLLGS